MPGEPRTRLAPEVFGLDLARLRQGYYSDQYFNNIAWILSRLASEGYRYPGGAHRLAGDPVDAAVGDLVVELQFFTRRAPDCVAAGVDHALAILASCAGELDDDGQFHPTADRLEVEAVCDGDRLEPWQTAILVRGRYRDFARLETMMLGALSRATRVATNVFNCYQASRGKSILFFPARFDLHETQRSDGYAYLVGHRRYHQDRPEAPPPLVSTQAQGEWWGGRGGGTVAHAYVLSFFGDTAEAMLQFARLMPAEVRRIALVDTNNDCVGDTLATARALFTAYRQRLAAGDPAGAEQYRLDAVRPDTGAELRDESVEPLGDPALDCGVCPRLVTNLRQALDSEPERLPDLTPGDRALARDYFRQVKIVVTGGFSPERIARFEQLGVPVDIYGVGSSLLSRGSNDYTADVVRVQIDGRWHAMAKVGRSLHRHDGLRPVTLCRPAS